jgi:hypothetical protein
MADYREPRQPRASGINVRLPSSLHRALRAASVREDRNLKDLLAEIGRAYLETRHPDLHHDAIAGDEAPARLGSPSEGPDRRSTETGETFPARRAGR